MSARAWTLATRLAVWFALAGAVVFGATGVYLYKSLERQLLERDDADLIGAVSQVRRDIERLPDPQAVRAEARSVENQLVSHPGLRLEVRDAHGALLVASQPAKSVPMPAMPVPVGLEPGRQAVEPLVGGGRLIGVRASLVGRPDQEVTVTVASEQTPRMALLATYSRHLLGSLVTATLVVALLGSVVAWRALRPVRTVASTARGITANRLAERLRLSEAPAELADLVEAFNAMLERLDESFRRLAQFSSDLAHELRTPIGNLMSGTHVALSRLRTTEEYQALLNSHLEEYERISRMIESMLFLARADNAQVAVRPELLDAAAELRCVADYFEALAAEAGIALEIDSQGKVSADPALFRRAVANLVENALRFSPPGAVVRLRAFQRAGGRFVVEVQNAGAGIAPEHLPHVFERFYRVDSARRDSVSNSGLGLAIVRSIIALHGGDVEVQSTPATGTAFRLVFPRSISGGY
jgi:two-component system, OmpR family, heavy metal sensor histidine kinase CusS